MDFQGLVVCFMSIPHPPLSLIYSVDFLDLIYSTFITEPHQDKNNCAFILNIRVNHVGGEPRGLNISKLLMPRFKVTRVQGKTARVTESIQRSCWKTIDLAQ